MKPITRRWIIATLMALAVAATVIMLQPRKPVVEPVSATDEAAAAEALLAAKLSGPRYFNPQVDVALEDRGRWIEVFDAVSQVPRIAAERHLGPEAVQAVRQLIVELSEPHPYRMVGGQRINLLRLNLSLDAIK